MARQIKFRAWNFKEMIYNVSVRNSLIQNHDDSFTYRNGESNYHVMQYTGLKDKNGKEIYEGDIYHQGDENIKYQVIFKDCCFVGNQIGNESLSGLSYFIKDIEVIGNIYENKKG